MGAFVGHGTGGDEDYTPLVPQVRVRIAVDCATVAELVERYCRFVDADRIFIATDAVEAAGALVQFRVDLSDGRAAIHGTGTVIESRPEPIGRVPRGMLLRFVALDEASARVIERMAATRARSTPSFGAPTLDKARGWRTQSVERELVLPANPFGDVPEAALAYFVDWSLERSGSLALRRGPKAVAFARVRMQAPRRRRRQPPVWMPFVVGLVAGAVALVALVHATAELERLRYAASPAPGRGAPAAPPSLPSAPSPPAAPPGATPRSPAAAEPIASSPSARDAAPPSARDAPPLAAGQAPLAIAAEPGATVTIDGARVGRTPLVVYVAGGAHVVELSRPRYQTARLEVDAPGRASAHLERPRATLHVTSNVADAEVIVDGAPAGVVPLSADVAGYERCRVEVRAPDGRSWHKRVYVRPPLTDLAATFAGE